ncbi:MAG TPA: ABC transporter permease, partial [Bryobacteraceae bacterium]|nr:ABC transporter permease [Bryobacteraceae bacterium]
AWLESVFHDLRYALRAMRRTPLVTAVAVLSIALGIGANTAIFSVLDALLLRSLPVKDPRHVVVLSWSAPPRVAMSMMRSLATYRDVSASLDSSTSFSYPVFEKFRAASKTASQLFAFVDLENAGVAADGRADLVPGELVSGNYYATLGIAPAIGRAFTDDDDRENAEPVCTISYRYWESRFGLDPAVVGKRIGIDNVPFTIVGVEPQGFLGLTTGAAPSVVIPLHHAPKFNPDRSPNRQSPFLDAGNWWVQIGGRLNPGVPRSQARAEFEVMFRQTLPRVKTLPTVELSREGEGLNFARDQYRDPLLVLMAVVAVVLLVACANVANLLLARSKNREKETAMRLALGAGRGRLARQLLTESILLAFLGAAIGVGLAYWASDLLVRFNGLVLDVHPSAGVLAFTAAIAMITGILFGLAPAIRTARANLQPGLQRSSAVARAGPARMLIVAQLALSLIVLVGAGLYLRTLRNLRSVDLGIDAQHLLVLRILPDRAGYAAARARDFDGRVLSAIERIPGIQSAGISRHIPLAGSARTSTNVSVAGREQPSSPRLRRVFINVVSQGFLETLKIPLLAGRGIEERDRAGAPPVAVVNETFAHAFLGDEPPLGHYLHGGMPGYASDVEIVGVTRDSKYDAIRSAVPPTIFLSYQQSASDGGNMAFEARTSGSPLAMVGAVRQAIAGLDPGVPFFQLNSEADVIDNLLRQDRLFAGLSSAFAALALLLAAIGLYGARAYSVARRIPEIGIRMALGADRATILRMIFSETGWLALFGVAIGLAGAYGLTRYLESMLFGVAPRDLTTFAAATLILVAVAALASFLPARRASRVEPLTALRHE